jgi:hypothetical protein
MIPKSVEEQLLFSTLRIEILSANNELQSIGTGFLLAVKLDDLQAVILLVTNKHVLQGGKNLRLSFHKKNLDKSGPQLGSTHQFTIFDYRQAVREHTDQNIDLACINVSTPISNLNNEIYYTCIDESLLATFDEEELDVAQRITFIGYPDNRFDYAHNLPVFRSGLIASHPKVDFNGMKQFIIDAQVFPGSSGSPVLINLTLENYKKQIVVGGPQKIKLLGVVAATMIRHNRIEVLPTGLPQQLVTQETIGLGIIYKSTALRELIDYVVDRIKRNQ